MAGPAHDLASVRSHGRANIEGGRNPGAGHYHGDAYTGSYSSQRLAAEARRIERLRARGLDVHAYFNNDADAHAVRNALDLRRYVENAAGRAGRRSVGTPR